MKALAVVFFAFTFSVSAQIPVDDDWYVSVKTKDTVAFYRNVTPIAPAQFHVDIMNVYRPGTKPAGDRYVYKMLGKLQVNCLTRHTKIIADKAIDNKGVEIQRFENLLSRRDKDGPPSLGTTQRVVLDDVCGENEIEWNET